MQERFIDYKNQLTSYITQTFFKDQKTFAEFIDSKSVLTVLTEISSLSHRYSQKGDEKLKRLLVKQCIILLYQIELVIQYAELTVDYSSIDLSKPSAYSPFKASDIEVNLADTIGKMCCNLSIIIWNDFKEKNYSTTALIQRFKQIKENSFSRFLLELQLYIIGLLLKQTNRLINDVLPSAFYIRNKNDKVLNLLNSLKKNKEKRNAEPVKNETPEPIDVIDNPVEEQTPQDEVIEPAETPKVTIIEQPEIIQEEPEEQTYETLQTEEAPENLIEIKNAEDAQENLPPVEELVSNTIVLKESHVTKDGALEETKIKTTIIKG